ncbi:retron Eco8 family effector endonuclease [Clostridium estertheticum]|uniref:retron Eco8 family effector endonuclease n=1 Tax=Clostridium estertheticum TaxID=238834 RepID=UPI001C0D2C6D|nr:retron Eco8 family effector endonuclease [Clostridium estertheticum]MBU3202213.1 retron Eco8 family effector endonuclease [Clostridium estertheticum]WAG67900.1 retron Eco8 family effector endonuclease [Clostridium estertheticum]
MGLIRVDIENFKSIDKCSLRFDQINLFLGRNGTGKSNLLSAIQYFFDNLISKKESDDIFDNNNTLNNRLKIAVTFDLKRIKKICYVNLNNEGSRYESYYNHIVKLIKDDEITIEMVKIKEQRVRWSYDMDIRRLIASLFPLYFVDSRKIDLVNWKSIWKSVGDLVRIENSAGLGVKDNIKKAVLSEEMIERRIEMVNDIFVKNNIKVTTFSTNEFAAAVSQVYFSGTEFSFRENKLINFSNGTNSFNFMNLLICILKMISESKMKEPIIILDEPEISLHNEMIDTLTHTFCECSEHMVFIMATHSPRLVKNILVKDEGKFTIYQICKADNYSTISKFNMLRSEEDDLREKYCITDQHASAYFAKSLLLVEGESEMELFQNKYLNSLFEQLRYAEVVKGMSNDVIYRTVSPDTRNCNIPIVSLIDMDKVYVYGNKIEDKYFMFNDKERYYFYRNGDEKNKTRANIKNKRKRIYSMAEKCKFNYVYPFFATEDETYMEFIELIKSYFSEYGIFVARTTIEGTLITMENKDKVIDFFNKEYNRNYNKNYNEIITAYNSFSENNNKLNFLRVIFNGKSDLIFNSKQIKKRNPGIEKLYKGSNVSLGKIIIENKISKTAWISKWLNFYFCNIAELDYSNDKSLYMFQKKILDEKEKKRIKKVFIKDFPELYNLIKMIYNTL